MPPSAALPRPEGHIYFSYSPTSPPNWGIASSDIHIFVYPNIRVALEVLLEVANAIQAQQLHRRAGLLTGHLLFRGNSDVTQRLLPTHLRGTWSQPPSRERFSVADPPMVMVHGVNLPSVSFDPGAQTRGSTGVTSSNASSRCERSKTRWQRFHRRTSSVEMPLNAPPSSGPPSFLSSLPSARSKDGRPFGITTAY
jgi:hypothetical protein